MDTVTFEVCLQSVDDAVAAERGGAQRVELCAALVEGGVTPGPASIARCRDAVDLDIMVMIRPRGGDFDYTERELEQMHYDVEFCRKIGVNGVAFGLLTPRGEVARTRVHSLCETAGELSVTFHRAFDVCQDPLVAMETLIELGVDRILTSGQEATVPEGLALIRTLHQRAAARIGILPGCGITPENLPLVLKETGCTEFHATAFSALESRMQHRNPKVYMGVPGLPEYERMVTSTAEVRRFLAAVGK